MHKTKEVASHFLAKFPDGNKSLLLSLEIEFVGLKAEKISRCVLFLGQGSPMTCRLAG